LIKAALTLSGYGSFEVDKYNEISPFIYLVKVSSLDGRHPATRQSYLQAPALLIADSFFTLE